MARRQEGFALQRGCGKRRTPTRSLRERCFQRLNFDAEQYPGLGSASAESPARAVHTKIS